MSRREQVALMMGLVGGFIFTEFLNALKGETNTCACSYCRRERWVRGEEERQDLIAVAYVGQYLKAFADQTFDELHEAALWIDGMWRIGDHLRNRADMYEISFNRTLDDLHAAALWIDALLHRPRARRDDGDHVPWRPGEKY